jgi:hypothetical protein
MATFGRTAGQDALAAGVEQDRQFYRDNFLQQSLDLRAIGLGIGAGNSRLAANNARADSSRMFDVAERAYARDVARSGTPGDATQQASRGRRLSLARVISEVDAANNASRGARAMRQQAQTFGTQFYGDLVTDSNSALTNIAAAEQDRETQYRNARDGSKGGLLGIAGMAASFI